MGSDVKHVELEQHPCNGVWGNTWWQFSHQVDDDHRETIGVSVNDHGVTAGLLEPGDEEMQPIVATLPLHGEITSSRTGTVLSIVDANGVELIAKSC